MKFFSHPRALLALGLASILALGSVVALAPSAQAADSTKDLKGVWVGTYSGFNNGGYVSGQEKIVITRVIGRNAEGTWQSRSTPTEKWSSPATVRLSLYAHGEPSAYISGADAEGTYVGKFNQARGRLTFTYSSQYLGLLVLTIVLTKKS